MIELPKSLLRAYCKVLTILTLFILPANKIFHICSLGMVPVRIALNGVKPDLIEVHGCNCNSISIRVAIPPDKMVAKPIL